MVADVSGLVQMLATQPGQQMAQLGGQLRQAEQDFQKQKLQEFNMNRAKTKDALELQVTNKELALKDLKIMSEKSDIAVPIAQGLLMAKDPMARQQLFEEKVSTLQQIGMDEAAIQDFRANLGNNEYLAAKVAQGLSAKDMMALYSGTGQTPSIAYKKKQELIAAGVPAEQAEGVAYGTYKVIDDAQGNKVVTDLRAGGKRVSADVADSVMGYLKPEGKEYEPRILTKGNKDELRLQKSVKELSKGMIATNAPKIESTLNNIEGIIASTYGEGKDLPGYGPLEGSAMYPDWVVSEKGQDLRQSVVKLFNMELADRSGAAVTPQELKRLKDEFKSGAWKTERQLVEGIQSYRAIIEDTKKAAIAGYDPSVVERYQKQGGITMKGEEPPRPDEEMMAEMPEAAQHSGRQIEDEEGNVYMSDGTEWIKQ